MQPPSPRPTKGQTSLKRANTNSPRKRKEGHKIYVYTRFSIYNPELKGFNTLKGEVHGEESYKDYMYNEERLDEKFAAFMSLTIPSILSQTYSNYEWLIFTSKEMPLEYRKILHKIVADIPKTKVVYVKGMDEFQEICDSYPLENSGTSTGFTTTRLDDDDGLHPTFFHQLTTFSEPGTIVSPSYGYKLSIEDDGEVLAAPYTRLPHCASQGLSLVGGNVYRLGNHMTIHSRKKGVHFLPKRGNYLIYAGGATSTKRKQEEAAKPFSLANYFKLPRLPRNEEK